MGSRAMIYIPSFIKTGSGIQKLIGWDIQKHRQHGDRISLPLFFENKETTLKTHQYNANKSLEDSILKTLCIANILVHQKPDNLHDSTGVMDQFLSYTFRQQLFCLL
jgi:hypothetical protein